MNFEVPIAATFTSPMSTPLFSCMHLQIDSQNAPKLAVEGQDRFRWNHSTEACFRLPEATFRLPEAASGFRKQFPAGRIPSRSDPLQLPIQRAKNLRG